MVKGIDHQTSGSVVVFMTSKLIAEIELGGDESNCLKKPLSMADYDCNYKGFPDFNYHVAMQWFTLNLLSPTNAGIIDFPTYLLGTLITILFPGPNSLYVLTITTLKGWRSGAWGALGIFIGDSVLMGAVVLGAVSLLISSPLAFNVVRLMGAAYLGWIGIGLVRSGLQRWISKADSANINVMQVRIMRLHPLAAALVLSLTNPKAIFFFIAFFSQFIRPDFERPLHTFFYLAIVLQLMSMAYLGTLICVGQYCLTYFQRRQRLAAGLWIVAGILFIGFALRLALA